MKKKLTLSIDDEIIKQAKAYAKGTDRSLSELIENVLARVVYGENVNESETSYATISSNNFKSKIDIPDFLKGIAGVSKADIDYVKDRDAIREERSVKY